MFQFPGFFNRAQPSGPVQSYGQRPRGLAGAMGGFYHPQMVPQQQRGMIQGNSPVAAQAQSYGQGMIGSSAPQQSQASSYGAAGGSYSPSAMSPQQGMISGSGPQTAQASMASQGPQNGQAMQVAQGQAYGAAPPTSPGQPAQGGYWHPQGPLPQQGMIQGNGPVNANASMGGLAAQIGVMR